MGKIALSNSAWQLMEQPWWVFKSDIQERSKTRVVARRNLSQLSPTPLLCEFNFSLLLSVREMMIGVLQQGVTLMLGKGYSKEMIQQTRWNLREEVRLLPTADVFSSFAQSVMMNIILWNCKAALKPSFQSNVCDLVSINDLAILIVMETRLGKEKVKEITYMLPFQGVIHTDTIGFAGDLWFL